MYIIYILIDRFKYSLSSKKGIDEVKTSKTQELYWKDIEYRRIDRISPK